MSFSCHFVSISYVKEEKEGERGRKMRYFMRGTKEKENGRRKQQDMKNCGGGGHNSKNPTTHFQTNNTGKHQYVMNSNNKSWSNH